LYRMRAAVPAGRRPHHFRAAFLNAIGQAQQNAPQVSAEPPLRCYVFAACHTARHRRAHRHKRALLWEQVVAEAREHVLRFDWVEVARRTRRLYAELASATVSTRSGIIGPSPDGSITPSSSQAYRPSSSR